MAAATDEHAMRAFKDARAFEAWLSKHHRTKSEIYIRIYKKNSGKPTVTHAQAIEVALCWGWIDGIRLGYDEISFLQRFSPRKAKSMWSKINCGHVERLIAAGRMTPHGLVHVTAAKADGRWAAAYAGSKDMEFPADLRAAIESEPKAQKTFETLNRTNRYALAFRLSRLKTAEGRRKRIAAFVAMLKRGETLHPNGKRLR